MERAHLLFGIIVFVVFLITGRLMRADFPDKDVIPQDFRLLMRSRHIYILLSAFVHILLGLYLRLDQKQWRKRLQILGSSRFLPERCCSSGRFFMKLTRQGIFPRSAVSVYTRL